MLRDEGHEVPPIAMPEAEAGHHDRDQSADLEHGQRGDDAGAEPRARDVDARADRDCGDAGDLQAHRRQRHEVPQVSRQARRQRGRDARVHHEAALPAVEKRDSRAPRLAQVDVSAAGLWVPRGQLAVNERPAQRHRAGDEPDHQQPEGRAQQARHRGRRQEDADRDDLADHQRGGAGQAQVPIHLEQHAHGQLRRPRTAAAEHSAGGRRRVGQTTKTSCSQDSTVRSLSRIERVGEARVVLLGVPRKLVTLNTLKISSIGSIFTRARDAKRPRDAEVQAVETVVETRVLEHKRHAARRRRRRCVFRSLQVRVQIARRS